MPGHRRVTCRRASPPACPLAGCPRTRLASHVALRANRRRRLKADPLIAPMLLPRLLPTVPQPRHRPRRPRRRWQLRQASRRRWRRRSEGSSRSRIGQHPVHLLQSSPQLVPHWALACPAKVTRLPSALRRGVRASETVTSSGVLRRGYRRRAKWEEEQAVKRRPLMRPVPVQLQRRHHLQMWRGPLGPMCRQRR